MIPMNAVLPAAAAGVMIGLAVRAALPTKPDLASLLDRLDAAHFTNAMPFAAPPGARGVPERVGARLLDEFGVRIRLPLSDLKLLRISPAEHLGKRVLFALYGLLAPSCCRRCSPSLAHRSRSLSQPASRSCSGPCFGSVPGRTSSATRPASRLIVRHAAASYLERVALARVANSGAGQALTQTAEVGDGWIFQRMRQVFDHAELMRRHTMGRPQTARRGTRHP